MYTRHVGKMVYRHVHKTYSQDGKPLTRHADITRHVHKIGQQDTIPICSQDMFTRYQIIQKNQKKTQTKMSKFVSQDT